MPERTAAEPAKTETRTRLRVSGLHKTYPSSSYAAVDGVGFEVQEGESLVLLGPSGCGKTTTLRCVAGLEQPQDGLIEIDGKPVYSSASRLVVPSRERDLGMVFQSYAIWPHMTVLDNAVFPLTTVRRKDRMRRSQMKARGAEALDLVRLSDFAKRRATDLSGGQQQRLALARALAGSPRLLLLDEPLSNLDERLRRDMRAELRDLQRRLEITMVYVTHDQVEALALGDRIAVMKDGRIEQLAGPQELYQNPANEFVARFLGFSNILPGTYEAVGDQVSVAAAIGKIRCRPAVEGASTTGSASVAFRAASAIATPVGHADGPRADMNVLTGRLESSIFVGEAWECQVDVNGESVRATARAETKAEVGETVNVSIPVNECIALFA